MMKLSKGAVLKRRRSRGSVLSCFWMPFDISLFLCQSNNIVMHFRRGRRYWIGIRFCRRHANTKRPTHNWHSNEISCYSVTWVYKHHQLIFDRVQESKRRNEKIKMISQDDEVSERSSAGKNAVSWVKAIMIMLWCVLENCAHRMSKAGQTNIKQTHNVYLSQRF